MNSLFLALLRLIDYKYGHNRTLKLNNRMFKQELCIPKVLHIQTVQLLATRGIGGAAVRPRDNTGGGKEGGRGGNNHFPWENVCSNKSPTILVN